MRSSSGETHLYILEGKMYGKKQEVGRIEVEVLQRMHTSLHFMSNIKKRKLEYAGHVMRGSSGETHLYILEGKCMERNQEVGREGYGWMILHS